MALQTPIIFINFKTYDTVDGKKAVMLAKLCEKLARKKKVSIAIAVSALDIKAVAKSVRIPVFAQHIDTCDLGAHTGWIVPQALVNVGVKGTLINHAEHQLSLNEIKERVEKARSLGMITCVCADTLQTAKKVLAFRPDFIAYEPPALIGGDISVSSAQPKVLKDAANIVKGTKTKMLCGAGVKTAQDVHIALKQGTHGVLLASGITKAKDPKKALLDLIAGIRY